MPAYKDNTQGIAFVFPKEHSKSEQQRLNKFKEIQKNFDKLNQQASLLTVILSDIKDFIKRK